MKKQNVYKRLQAQYNKLNTRIQKAMKTGQFYAYTQFKQQQLLGRLKRCSLQLKQLGAGVAVVAALGMATPAVGQVPVYNLVERTGAANPFDGVTDAVFEKKAFVDIDGDNDLDFFVSGADTLRYFENTGTASVASFAERTGAANPLSGVTGVSAPAFVDIDADGDMDLFLGNYYYSSEACHFYENTGTATAANFSLQTGNNNPLDSMVQHLVALGSTSTVYPKMSFVDIDDDGDQDCFVAVEQYDLNWQNNEKFLYYENTGTATTATFLKQSNANNPLSAIGQGTTKMPIETITFFDAEKDGDLDILLHFLEPPATFSFPFYENTGSSTTPNFTLSSTSPIDSALGTIPAGRIAVYNLVDIDTDGDWDLIKKVGSPNRQFFYENLDTTITSTVKLDKDNTINIYPNPSQGRLFFTEAITGELSVYSITGQHLLTKEINYAQELDLSAYHEGVYVLEIKTREEKLQATILIQK